MSIVGVATYEPAWADASGARVIGHDEDVTTLAVAAGRALRRAAPAAPIGRIVVVSRRPDVLEGATPAVIALGLELDPSTPVEMRAGGAAAAADALVAAGLGTLVIGVDSDKPAGAGAALAGDGPGATLTEGGRVGHPLPMRVQRVGAAAPRVYDDARLERERGWKPALERLRAGTSSNGTGPLVVGVAARDARRLGAKGPDIPVTGPAAPFFALAELAADGGDRRVVALDAGDGVAFDVAGADAVRTERDRRPAVALSDRPAVKHEAEIPIALPAFERAFVSKIGLVASRCVCGELSYPPREVCPACGRRGETTPETLPRTGEIYTGVTVHVPVPGVPGPYALVIAELVDTGVRLLCHVTDAPATGFAIGDRGDLVLRRVAVREGINDYGYAWQPAVTQEVVA